VEDSNRKKNQVLANSLPNFHGDYATMGRIGEQFKNSFSSFHNNYTAIGKKIEKLFEIGSGLKSFLELQQKWPPLYPSSIFGEICWHNKYFTRLS